MNTLDVLEKFMVTEIAAVELGKKALEPDEDLLGSGIIDSMGVIKLVVFLEKTFDIGVSDEDVVPENFQSLNCIVKFVEQKIQNK